MAARVDEFALRGHKPVAECEAGAVQAPVWVVGNGGSIGLVSGAGSVNGVGGFTLVQPLLHPKHMRANSVPGILHDHELAPLELKTAGSLLD